MIPTVFLTLDEPLKTRRRHVVLHGCFKLLKKCLNKRRRHCVRNGCFKILKTRTLWLDRRAYSDVDVGGCYGQWRLTSRRLLLAMDNGG
jgi:hypothetical protein